MNFRTGLIIFVLLFLASCQKRNCLTSPVKSVGGCNEDGYCGVTLEDGTHMQEMYQPSIGMKFKVYCAEHPL